MLQACHAVVDWPARWQDCYLAMQEEERRMRQGTTKAVIFQVLKDAADLGMTPQEIADAAKEKGLKEFSGNQLGFIASVRQPTQMHS